MATKNFNKFLLLMWKNWMLQWRHPLQTFIEIIAPVLFSMLIVLVRSLVEPVNIDQPIHFNEFEINNTLPVTLPVFPFTPVFILHSPTNKHLNEIMSNVADTLNLNSYGFDNATEMNKILYQTNSNYTRVILCGIEFDDSLLSHEILNLPNLPPNLDIKIRYPSELRRSTSDWKTNFLFPLFQIPGPRNPNIDDGGYPPGYNSESFLSVQHELSYEIIRYFQKIDSNHIDLPNISLQRYPYPPYIDDPLLIAMSNFISMIVLLSFVYTAISIVKFITAEKEKQLKEAMKIMGLPNWIHWSAWFIKSLSFMLISIILIVVLFKVHWIPGYDVSVFTKSDGTVIFCFLFIYICTTITFCFMISVFFSKASTASTIGGLVWFLSYSPFLFLQMKYESLLLSEKLLACLGSNTAMAYGFQFFLMAEGTGEGLQWGTIWKPITPDDSFVLGHVLIMLIIDALIYLCIALYVEGVYPGSYGVPLPFYFPFTYSYWCGNKSSDFDDIDLNEKTNSNRQNYEADPYNIPIGIQIKHLHKEFKHKVAVRDLSLNLYEGQITVLLGHNGAGKTTTMSMLTGMYTPTKGTAIVAGHDIRKNITGVRDSLGLCPQHNILYDDLTVEEHIYFFSKLKGLNKQQIDSEIKKYIKLLDLESKAKALSKTLSGGMKRKLSVCVALCGNSKVVILDEPTAGMDPSARRSLWDLLQAEKKNRTLLLSTHFMDEADLLGDRIAIMAGGVIQCCGSSFFLKKRYGVGYHLTIDKSLQSDVNKITDLLRKHIPETQAESNVGSELTYLLPENQISVFEPMLKDLEDATDLGILNYGISLTTLEEVFMKVGADHGQEEELNALDLKKENGQIDIPKDHILGSDMSHMPSETTLNMGDKLLTGSKLYLNQFYAMLIKKIYSTINGRILFLVQNFIPIVFIVIAITVIRSMLTNDDLPALEMTLKSYDDPITVINGTNSFKTKYFENLKSSSNQIVDIGGKNLDDYVLSESEENLPSYRLRYITGATFGTEDGEEKIKTWFNNEAYHSIPLALNLVHNSILKTIMNDSYNIVITNFPQPFTIDTKLSRLLMGNNIGFQIAFNIGFSMGFLSAFYVIFYVRERVSKSKHLQFVSGVNPIIFWITSYLWDMITFIFTAILLMCVLAIFQEDGFATFEELGRLLLSLILFAYAVLPVTYLASYSFEIPATGYSRMTLINIFLGCGGYLLVEILSNPVLDLKNVADILGWVFLFVPHYGITNAIKKLYSISSLHNICKEPEGKAMCAINGQCCDDNEDYFGFNSTGIGRNLVFFIITGTVAFILLLCIEYRLPERILYFLQTKSMEPPLPSEEDDDIAKERLRVNALSTDDLNSHNLVLKDFSKYYKKFLAVQRLTLSVKENECFGLLGVNGAGKTSTFRMLTGDETISYGNAWMKGKNLKTSMKEVHKHIGYCPQFDALLDDLTGRETMMMFCLLRGIPRSEIKFIVQKLACEFDFIRHIDKKVKQYSGGNKRKLSTAIALIGDPYIVYLDEPTTGMDPAAKRYIWNSLCKIRDNGKCIILTSHSMEECEALCTRLAIMVNGNFQCLGSVQHLKSKFSEGYTLTIKVKKINAELNEHETEPINEFIKDKFPSAVLREQYQELLTYYISDRTMPWSQMFGIMERGKKSLAIEDYSLGQSNLEQVFLKFTKLQRSETP